ncbi:hypothetical protein CYMTET_27462, partial [Cymbomonas tetramitiformis]
MIGYYLFELELAALTDYTYEVSKLTGQVEEAAVAIICFARALCGVLAGAAANSTSGTSRAISEAVSEILTDLAANKASRQSLALASKGAVVDWLLDAVATSAPTERLHKSALQTLGYLLQDEATRGAVLKRRGAIPILLAEVQASQRSPGLEDLLLNAGAGDFPGEAASEDVNRVISLLDGKEHAAVHTLCAWALSQWAEASPANCQLILTHGGAAPLAVAMENSRQRNLRWYAARAANALVRNDIGDSDWWAAGPSARRWAQGVVQMLNDAVGGEDGKAPAAAPHLGDPGLAHAALQTLETLVWGASGHSDGGRSMHLAAMTAGALPLLFTLHGLMEQRGIEHEASREQCSAAQRSILAIAACLATGEIGLPHNDKPRWAPLLLDCIYGHARHADASTVADAPLNPDCKGPLRNMSMAALISMISSTDDIAMGISYIWLAHLVRHLNGVVAGGTEAKDEQGVGKAGVAGFALAARADDIVRMALAAASHLTTAAATAADPQPL